MNETKMNIYNNNKQILFNRYIMRLIVSYFAKGPSMGKYLCIPCNKYFKYKKRHLNTKAHMLVINNYFVPFYKKELYSYKCCLCNKILKCGSIYIHSKITCKNLKKKICSK